MNCQRFHDQLFDYLDGSLSSAEQSAAEEHVGQCADCARAVRAHQGLARRFQREADVLPFGSNQRQRIEAALAPVQNHSAFWRRLAWPSAIAAALAVAAGLSLAWPRRAPASPSISIRLSYNNSIYTFQREKNSVVDALVCTPQVTEAERPVPPTQERTTPL